MNDPRHAPQPVASPKPTPVPAHHPPVPTTSHPHIPATPARPVLKQDLEPIGLDDDGLSPTDLASADPLVANAASLRGAAPKIQAFGVSMGSPNAHASHQWKRTPHVTGTGICRVKTFHGRLSDQGMDFLDTTINEWLDAHPEVDVKAVTTTTNLFDGKMKELALIVNIWY
jgi:hypothetical protein